METGTKVAGGPAVLGLKRSINCEDEASHEHVVSPFASLDPRESAGLCIYSAVWST